MVIFHSAVKLPEGIPCTMGIWPFTLKMGAFFIPLSPISDHNWRQLERQWPGWSSTHQGECVARHWDDNLRHRMVNVRRCPQMSNFSGEKKWYAIDADPSHGYLLGKVNHSLRSLFVLGVVLNTWLIRQTTQTLLFFLSQGTIRSLLWAEIKGHERYEGEDIRRPYPNDSWHFQKCLFRLTSCCILLVLTQGIRRLRRLPPTSQRLTGSLKLSRCRWPFIASAKRKRRRALPDLGPWGQKPWLGNNTLIYIYIYIDYIYIYIDIYIYTLIYIYIYIDIYIYTYYIYILYIYILIYILIQCIYICIDMFVVFS